MPKAAYWIVLAVLVAFAIAGALRLFEPPMLSNVNSSEFEQFYRSQYIMGTVVGLALGSLLGWLATGRIYHEPRERGADFTGRVVTRGVVSGLSAAGLVAVVALIYASMYVLGPLAPQEKVMVILENGLFYVVMAIGMVAAMLAYAVATRLPTWGGQYALI